MRLVSPAEAVRAVPDGGVVILPHVCAQASGFNTAFEHAVERFSGLTVLSGLSFGSYAFLNRGLGRHFRYVTWQASPRIRQLFAENDPAKVGFIPIRLADLTRVVGRHAIVRPDVAVVQTSMPAADGTVSLGISVGPNRHFIDSAKLVIAEFNANMPVTAGSTRVPLDAIDLAYESAEPLLVYATGDPKPRDQQIIEHVLALIPDGAWVQFGIGAVPDRILARLWEKRDVNVFSGLLTRGLMDFVDRARHTPRVINGELAGDAEFYEFCGRTPLVTMEPTSVTHDVARIARLPGFVSINSAIEVDLQGQTNGEQIGTTQISGVGGALDYMEAAALSDGGISIVALPATTDDGKRSKIVANFATGTAITTPRYCTDYVVTEFGTARLKGRDLTARARALIDIAHPDFRADLDNRLAPRV